MGRQARASAAAGVTLVLAALVFMNIGGTAAYSPSAGNMVTTSTPDWVPSLTEIADPCVLRNATTGTVFLKSHATCTGSPSVAVGDIQVATASGSTGVSVVSTAGGPAAALGPLGSFLRFVEKDAVVGFSAGDIVFLDFTTGVAGCTGAAAGLGACDVRLNTYTVGTTKLTAGTTVAANNADVVEGGDADGTFPDTLTASTFTGDSGSLYYADRNENGRLDTGTNADTIYLRMGAAPTDFTVGPNAVANIPVVLDLRLTALGSRDAGTFVSAGDPDLVPVLQAPPSGLLVCWPKTTCRDNPTATDPILIAFKTTPAATFLSVGDLPLNTVGGQVAGVSISTAAHGVGRNVTVATESFADSVFYIDRVPEGVFGPEDPVYLNRPTSIGGVSDSISLTERDVRLRVPSGMPYQAGSVVRQNDQDMQFGSGVRVCHTGAMLTPACQGPSIKHFAAHRASVLGDLRAFKADTVRASGGEDGGDGAATWNLGDLLYASSSGSTLTGDGVAAGWIRILPAVYNPGSIVQCSQDADCGSAVTGTNRIKITGADAVFDPVTEYAYLSDDGTINNGDIRLTPRTFGITHPAGQPVNCSVTPLECGEALTGPTNACLSGTNTNYAAGEVAYYNCGTSPTVVEQGFTRIMPINLPGETAVAASDIDVGLRALPVRDGSVKLAGDDNTYAVGDDVYASANGRIDAGDRRLTHVRLNGQQYNVYNFDPSALTSVGAGHADVASAGVGLGDTLYVSGTSLTSSRIPLNGDARVLSYGAAAPGSVGPGEPDFTPRLLTFNNAAADDTMFCLGRDNRGNNVSLADDTFYAIKCGTTIPGGALDFRALRLTGVASAGRAFGTFVTSSDPDKDRTLVTDPAGPALFSNAHTFFHFIDSSGSKRANHLDSGDWVYLDMQLRGNASLAPADDNKISEGDIRLTKVTTGGKTYEAGTVVKANDEDEKAHRNGSFGFSPRGTTAEPFRGKYIDANGNGAYDAGEHLVLTHDFATCGGACSGILRLGDLFLSGTGAPPPTTTGTDTGTSTSTQTGTSTSTNTGTTTSTTSTTTTSSTTTRTTTSTTPVTTTTSATTTDTQTTTGNTTTNGGGGNGSPGPAPIAVGLVLVGVALYVRRRL